MGAGGTNVGIMVVLGVVVGPTEDVRYAGRVSRNNNYLLISSFYNC